MFSITGVSNGNHASNHIFLSQRLHKACAVTSMRVRIKERESHVLRVHVGTCVRACASACVCMCAHVRVHVRVRRMCVYVRV